jgi:hypothetical protein
MEIEHSVLRIILCQILNLSEAQKGGACQHPYSSFLLLSLQHNGEEKREVCLDEEAIEERKITLNCDVKAYQETILCIKVELEALLYHFNLVTTNLYKIYSSLSGRYKSLALKLARCI